MESKSNLPLIILFMCSQNANHEVTLKSIKVSLPVQITETIVTIVAPFFKKSNYVNEGLIYTLLFFTCWRFLWI